MSHVIAPRFIGPALGDGGYQVGYSCRFNDDDTAYLSRTPSSTGNTRVFTLSAWVKRATIVRQFIVGAGSSNPTGLTFNSDATIQWQWSGNMIQFGVPVYRDPSAWYHVVLLWDTAQGTPANRVRLWVNGIEQTQSGGATNPSQNYDELLWSIASEPMNIGRYPSGLYFDGYLAQVAFTDGQALTASSFGEFDANGVWRPIDVSGLTFGTNGFLLDFADASDLGNDVSGNNNDFTSSGLTTADRMLDTPTVNFPTLNPLINTSGWTFSDGNLVGSATSSGGSIVSTIVYPTGKWYSEHKLTGTLNPGYPAIGLLNSSKSQPFTAGWPGDSLMPVSCGAVPHSNNAYMSTTYPTATALGVTFAQNDILMLAFDAATRKVWFGRNGTWCNSGDPAAGTGEIFILSVGDYYFCHGDAGAVGTNIVDHNFGQRPFTYTPPTGFKALNTANLPEPTIKDGTDNFDVVLDTGANIKSASETVFPSFLEWIKDRQNSNNHQLIDSVRGTSAVLQSNTTAAETTYSAPSGNSVGWVWKANGTGASNTAGSITSTVSSNTAAGFSVVTYTGTGNNATVGHGLGRTPNLIIVKERNMVQNWRIYHSTLGAGNYLSLDLTNASFASSIMWNNTSPTNSVFSVGTDTSSNENGQALIAYCFAEIPGYSKFGSYVGNGSADGPFIWCGFKPAFLLVKNSSVTSDWVLFDAARAPFNVAVNRLMPNLGDAERTTNTNQIDIVSSGYKARSGGGDVNTSNDLFIYAAFAEYPFGGEDTTPATAR